MSDHALKKGYYTTFGNKIGLYAKNDNGFIHHHDDVVLYFPFKDCVLEAGMNKEDSKRNERFLHLQADGRDIDVLFEPKVLTNYQHITPSTPITNSPPRKFKPAPIF